MTRSWRYRIGRMLCKIGMHHLSEPEVCWAPDTPRGRVFRYRCTRLHCNVIRVSEVA